MLGHLLIAAYLQWELLVLDYGFSVKSDCPVFFASEVLLLMHSLFYFINVIKGVSNMHLLVAKDYIMKLSFAEFSE